LLNIIKCEFFKLKRKKPFYIAFMTSIIMPILYSIILKNKNLDDMMSVVREENGFLILIPLSVIIAAGLFFEEHNYDTLKNIMCIPISKSSIVISKIFVILVFDIGYQLLGYALSFIIVIICGISLDGWQLQLWLTLCTGILLWAASMPCILFVVWFNKSYIISVIIAFAYMTINYILHISDKVIMVPLGLNVASFIPVPVIFRWLYQFNSIEGAGEILTNFYNRFRPYFISTPAVFAIMIIEALICIILIIRVYQKQNV